ncbi:hypothetical protein DFH06DRAFT_1088383 [Mycena polygramma]|nr:hypothetical protein DFH06DRAFT_1088383 [Mycena polygramma]
MHPCLYVQDIVEILLEPQVRQDLAAISRTCKAFHSPALDLLWKSATLENLLRLLPSDICAFSQPDWNAKFHIRLLRPLHSTDWDRVRVYAPRVRELGVIKRDDFSALFPALAEHLPDNLLCNLRHLSWFPPDSEISYIHLFLSTTVTSISLGLPTDFPTAVSLYSLLVSRCPRLQHLLISQRFEHLASIADVETLSTFVCMFHSLESINVPLLDDAAVQHLRSLSTLKSWTLHEIPPAATFVARAGTKTLPSLSELRLPVTTIHLATRFLASCRQVPLQSFYGKLQGQNTTAETEDFFAALVSGISHTTLTSLFLDNPSQGWRIHDPEKYTISTRSIHALLQFSCLTSLSIWSSGGFDIDDAAVHAMATQWPNIETLRLCALFSPPPRTTLASLRQLAYSCPHLRTLTITVDCTVLPPASDTAKPGFQPPLTQVDVNLSPIDATAPVAAFLVDVFPNLRSLQYPFDTGYYALWVQVAATL